MRVSAPFGIFGVFSDGDCFQIDHSVYLRYEGTFLMRAGLQGIATFGILASFWMGAAVQAQSISMSYVTVGNPGNAADPNTGGLYGSVSYTYEIGEYDVTDSQYVTFLNDVDPSGANTLGLYDSSGTTAEYGITFNPGAANGSKYSVIQGYANMPVVYVTYWDTLRFVNWMNNGEGNASTETGTYTLLGGTPTPSNSSSLLANPQPNAGSTVQLPDENEWYKAAYYDPQLGADGGYWDYATQSDTAPGNVVGAGANEANYNNGVYSVTQSSSFNTSQNYLTAVGSFTHSASFYGTYDQSGDVLNLMDADVTSQSPVYRGGDWYNNAAFLSSDSRGSSELPSGVIPYLGFRVASVPEPHSFRLMLAGIAGLTLMHGKFNQKKRKTDTLALPL